MSIDVFKRIIDKAKEEGYKRIGLFNWIEPFLSKDLDKFISIVKGRNLFVVLSSNLSLKPDNNIDFICKVLKTGVDHLTVSVSGFDQEIYAINHVGGNLSWVKSNLERIAQLKREGSIATNITLRLIEFSYNSGEKYALKKYANSLGIAFETIKGVCDPHDPVNYYLSEEIFSDRLKRFTPAKVNEKNGKICFLIMDTIAIDFHGDSYLCCAYPYYSSLRIGPYLEMSKEELFLQRCSHPICNSCNMPRRKATKMDYNELVKAIKSRLGRFVKAIKSRLERKKRTRFT